MAMTIRSLVADPLDDPVQAAPDAMWQAAYTPLGER